MLKSVLDNSGNRQGQETANPTCHEAMRVQKNEQVFTNITGGSVEHCTPHAGGAPLHFTGLTRMIKFYLLPTCWQSVEEAVFCFNLQ